MSQTDTRIRHLGFIQLRVVQGEIDSNLGRLEQLLEDLDPPRQSLVVLPELWATGFAYLKLPKLRQHVAKLAGRLQQLAARYDILLAGSLPEPAEAAGETFFNALDLIGGEGAFGRYRKQYVFPGEERSFRPSPGAALPIATPAGVFGCLICYDLRFPELVRGQCQQGADLLLCSAEWPAARIEHWRTLAVARAIENQTFLVACNGVGNNGPLPLGGHSLVVSPTGEILQEAGEEETAQLVTIDWQVKEQAQATFKSFTAAPCRPSADKIATAEKCVAQADRRARIGQRVVYVVLLQGTSLSQSIDMLEAARQQGDYLVVGLHGQAEHGTPPVSDTDSLLKLFAALGCVDAVFDAREMAPAAEQRLREICRSENS